ncbi:MAG: tetratricopeptide repeat protein [Phycisphaerae bacterium]
MTRHPADFRPHLAQRAAVAALAMALLAAANVSSAAPTPKPIATARPAPATKPAPPAELDDRWLSVVAMEEFAKAAKDGDWPGLEKRAQELIYQRLVCGRLDRLQALNDLVYCLRAARYLPMADKIDATKKLSAWLAANRDVSRLLFRAMQDVAAPEDSLKKFQALLAADENRVQAYANLAVAFATSLPMAHYVKQPNPASMLDSFGWYTNPRGSFLYDLKAMPYELSRYLADTQLSIGERQWAAGRYPAGRTDLPATYRDPPFDLAYFFRGTPKKLNKAEYTLANILSIGGVCIDEAYFASQICKAAGMPACIVTGRNAAGGAHAWLACFKLRLAGAQAAAEWDANTGRYAEQKYYTGTLTDPATGKKIHDSELALLGAAALLPLDRREEADAATALAAMVAAVVKSPPPADAEELKKLAEEYNKTLSSRVKAGDPKRDTSRLGTPPPAVPAQITAVRKIDASLVEDLILEAANHNIAHRQVWELVLELRKSGGISTECLDRLLDFLVSRTAKDYPDYSCMMILQLAPTYEEPARREKIYLGCIDIYPQRPDLQGQFMIALGDDYAKAGKKDQAFQAYQKVITGKTREITEVYLLAVTHTEELLVAANKRDDAIRMYSQLFDQARKPRVDGGYPQSAYYRLGKRLAELLTEANQPEAAKKIYEKIGERTEPAIRG